MARSLAPRVLCVGYVCFAACGQVTTTDAPLGSPLPQSAGAGDLCQVPTGAGGPSNDAVSSAVVAKSNASGPHLTYYGGRVVSNMHVVQVLWGKGTYAGYVSSTSSPSMATFYQGVLNSAYLDWLVEYNTPTQTIGRGAFDGQYSITPSSAATTIDDATIRAELAQQIASGKLPAPRADAKGNPTTYYAVFFPHGDVITQGGSSSCAIAGFCAYHGTIAAASGRGEAYYGVHPDMQSGSGCEYACGGSPQPFANQTSVASHEMVETITDAEVGLATVLGQPLAWYDAQNGEIGDICNGKQATVTGADGVTYTVQTEYSNQASACIASKPPSTDFTLALTPSSASVVAGAAISASVVTTGVSGSSPRISLSVSGAPSGVTVSLAASSLVAGSGTTLAITSAPTTTPGAYTLTVTGTAASTVHTATLALTVASNLAVTATPAQLTLTAGGTGATRIAVTGGSDAVALSSTGLPAGVLASFNPVAIKPGATSTLTFTSSQNAAQGKATVTVAATTLAGLSRTTAIALTVTGNSISVAASPATLSVAAGGTATAVVTTGVASGVAQPVTLSVSNLPAGVTAAMSPSALTAGGRATLTFTAAATALCGTTTITITANAPNGGAKTTSIALTVTGNDFSLSASPTALTLAAGKTATSTLRTTLTTGARQAIAFRAEGLPAGFTVAFAPTGVQTGASTVATFSSASTVAAGSWTVNVIATGPNAVHATPITLTVPAPPAAGIVNGGFENQLSGWTTTGSPALAMPGHSGSYSYAGVSATSSVTESSASQTFTVPAAKTRLTFWYAQDCSPGTSVQWGTATLLNHATGALTTVMAKTCQMSGWTQVTVAVTAGVSYTLTFVNHDASGGSGSMLTVWDDVALL